MKRLGRLSLRVRLTLLFLLLTSAAWGIASLVAWQQTADKLDKLFDTQQLLFARRLSAMNVDELHTLAPQVREQKKVKHGHLDDDALAFAIFTADGKMVLNDGENGQDIPWGNHREGSAMATCAATMTSGASCGLPPAMVAIVSPSVRSGITAARWRWISSPPSLRPGWLRCR